MKKLFSILVVLFACAMVPVAIIANDEAPKEKDKKVKKHKKDEECKDDCCKKDGKATDEKKADQAKDDCCVKEPKKDDKAEK